MYIEESIYSQSFLKERLHETIFGIYSIRRTALAGQHKLTSRLTFNLGSLYDRSGDLSDELGRASNFDITRQPDATGERKVARLYRRFEHQGNTSYYDYAGRP